MIVEKSMSDGWLSNTYLLADRPGGKAVLIDTGGPMGPIVHKLESLRLELTYVLCTHHHIDHVQFNDAYRDRFGCPVCGHRNERELFGRLDQQLEDGDELVVGDLHIRALLTPGHTVGQLAYLVNEQRVFTGDTLFRRTVGGTVGPGHASFEDLQYSIMDILMRLPHGTEVYPGHTDSSTIGEEWEQNPFIRTWRGLDTASERPCTVGGQPASLLLEAPDYDGGTKCWVRFDEGQRLAVVGGSRVQQR
ncbi:MAG: MBL fold metallo-hydrolase [Acidobacteriota bacterium]|nr:MBL fold metallo-hydrolase [Acidobacteriota bacterium]